jgi:cytochrome c oxidase subunit 2
MNWQLPLMLAQTEEKTILERVQATTLDGTKVPESALERTGTSNPFSGEYWFPEQASSFAGEVDYLFMAIFWISTLFFAGIVGSMIYFVLKYRRKGNVIDPQPSPSHNTAIEILWSVLPSILLVWMFYVGAETYFEMRVPRDDAEEIQVTAKQFGWVFTYPDGDTSAELHLVRDQPAKLVMQSEDVLHSFYVPAFRQKMDIVPGRYTYAFIEPTKTGEFRLSCNEYCGTGHSKMRTMAKVHMTAEDRKNDTQWIEAEYPPWKNGERIYRIQCSGCHKVDGTAATGPALNNIWGTEEKLMGGRTVKVDEQYVLDSIWEPAKDIVEGYGPVSKMNSFKGILDQADVNRVIAYLKYLKDPALVSDAPEAEISEEPAGSESDPKTAGGDEVESEK